MPGLLQRRGGDCRNGVAGSMPRPGSLLQACGARFCEQATRGLEHGETPGLGGEIDNPNWKKQWHGKKIYGPEGKVRIEVIKGTVDKNSADAIYEADGLAGATLTSRGVTNLLKYWMGENGYQPFLEKLKQEGVKP